MLMILQQHIACRYTGEEILQDLIAPIPITPKQSIATLYVQIGHI